MKKLLLLSLMVAFISNTNAQQCLSSGGCTSYRNQYPSTTYTPTTSWTTHNAMSPGNYTLFNVVSGTIYEWTYCEDYEGVSTSWDAQLTLSKGSTPSTPICFSTDVCGTKAPYISWTATFTGVVCVLTTQYSSGLGCKTALLSTYNTLAWRAVSSSTYSLTLTINNVGGATRSNARVALYDDNWTPISTLNSNSSGVVNFTNLANATYNYEIYYTPTGTNPPTTNEEFWGSSSATINGFSLSKSFTRTQPYISATTTFSPSSVTISSPTTGGFTVKNPLSYSQNTKVTIWVDRDETSTWDYTNQTSVQSISGGGTNDFSWNVTPTATGTYYKYAIVYTYLNSSYVITDQFAWETAFTANSSVCTSPDASVNSPTSASPLTISCTASGGSGGSIFYEWYSGNACSGNILGTSSTLQVTSSGNYSCLAYVKDYKSTCKTCATGYATVTTFGNQYGIDVSSNQGTINWPAVYAAGKVFSFARSTLGYNTKDAKFPLNMQNGKNAGVKMGAYHVAYPKNNTAITEANYFLSIAGDFIGSDYLPPALDLEPDLVESLGISTLTTWVQTWINTVKAAKGIDPIIYCIHYDAGHYLDASLNAYPLWIANYKTDPLTPPTNLGIWATWAYNQYNDAGTVSGISGYVDFDVSNGAVVTSVQEAKKSIEFSVFPNPTQGNFTIVVTEPDKDYHIRIINQLGQVVYKDEFNHSYSMELKLNVPPGIYFVQLYNKEKQYSQKLIIQ